MATDPNAPDASGDVDLTNKDDKDKNNGSATPPMDVDDENDGFGDEDNDGWGDDNGNDEFNDDGDGWGSNDDIEIADQKIDINPKEMERAKSVVLALTEDQIEEQIKNKIKLIKEELDLSEHDCLLLLRGFKWNPEKILEKYFENPEKVLADAGACTNKKTKALSSGEIECQVCMEDVSINSVYSLECGHQTTCKACWIDYLRDAVKTKSCISLVCPAFKCNVIIPNDTWKLFLEKKYSKDYKRYVRFCREDFIDCSKEYSHCPGKNCSMIYSCSGIVREVECQQCRYKFCWSCKQESHFPSSCHVAKKWLDKCSNESENIQYILAKTKMCPKCHVHIEKNQGCNHMTCRKGVGGCGYEFCWLCKGDWKEHGSQTGGYYQCNIYEKNKAKGVVSSEEKAAEDAKNELEKYSFHWTRFDSHLKSSFHAIKQREQTHDKMHDLAQKFGWNLNEAQFLLDATNEAITCWHVLAWTYAIGYAFDETKGNFDLFKGHQSYLERFCDGLQEKLDFDINKLGDNKTRQEIVHYTRTAAQYRKNLVEHIEGEISF